MRAEEVLRQIRRHPKGLWLRELARKSKVSAATVCNYIYGYRDRKGRFVKPALKRYVTLKKYGNRSVTLVFPR
jgi:hypothetical protein